MGKHTKQRCDSWAASLSQEDQWKIYAKFRIYNWSRLAEWIAKEYSIDAPSRSALYRWRDYMRTQESSRRIENALIAQTQTGQLAASRNITDRKLIDAWQTLAAELAINNNVDDAVKYTNMALALAAQHTKTRELALKTAAQRTKDEALSLAREKFEAAEGRLNAGREALKKVNEAGGLTPEGRAEIERAMGLI